MALFSMESHCILSPRTARLQADAGEDCLRETTDCAWMTNLRPRRRRPRGIVTRSCGTGLAAFCGEVRRKAGSGTYLLLKGRCWTRVNSRAPYNSPFLREEVVMFIVTEAAGGYLTAVLDKTNISEGSA